MVTWHLHGCWGSKPRSSRFHGKCFIYLSISPDHQKHHFKAKLYFCPITAETQNHHWLSGTYWIESKFCWRVSISFQPNSTFSFSNHVWFLSLPCLGCPFTCLYLHHPQYWAEAWKCISSIFEHFKYPRNFFFEPHLTVQLLIFFPVNNLKAPESQRLYLTYIMIPQNFS